MPISTPLASGSFSYGSDLSAGDYLTGEPVESGYSVASDSTYFGGTFSGTGPHIRPEQVSGFVVTVDGAEVSGLAGPISVRRSVSNKFQSWSFSVRKDPNAGRAVPWAGNNPFEHGMNPFCNKSINIGIRYRNGGQDRIRWLIVNGIADPQGCSVSDNAEGAIETISGFDAAARYDQIPISCVIQQGSDITVKEAVEHLMSMTGASGSFGSDSLGRINREISFVDASAIDACQQILDPFGYRLVFDVYGRWSVKTTEPDLGGGAAQTVNTHMLDSSGVLVSGKGEPISCVRISGEEFTPDPNEPGEDGPEFSCVISEVETVEEGLWPVPKIDSQSTLDGSITPYSAATEIEGVISRTVTRTKTCNGTLMWRETKYYSWYLRESSRYEITVDSDGAITSRAYTSAYVIDGTLDGNEPAIHSPAPEFGLVSIEVFENIWADNNFSGRYSYPSAENQADLERLGFVVSGSTSAITFLDSTDIGSFKYGDGYKSAYGRKNKAEILYLTGRISKEERDAIQAAPASPESAFAGSGNPGSGYLVATISVRFDRSILGGQIRPEVATSERGVAGVVYSPGIHEVYGDGSGYEPALSVSGVGLWMSSYSIVKNVCQSYYDPSMVSSVEASGSYGYPHPASGSIFVFTNGYAAEYGQTGLWPTTTVTSLYTTSETSTSISTTTVEEETGRSKTTTSTGGPGATLERLPWHEPISVADATADTEDGNDPAAEPLANDEEQCFIGERREGSFGRFEAEVCNDDLVDCIGERWVVLTLDGVSTLEEAEDAALRILREASRVSVSLSLWGLNPTVLEGGVIEPVWPPRGLSGRRFRVDSVAWDYGSHREMPTTKIEASMVPDVTVNATSG